MKGEGFIGKSDGVDRVLPRTRVFDRKHDRSANFRTPRRPLRTRRADEKGKVWPQGHGASSPGSSRVRSLRSFSRFVNETMRAARSFSETRELVFPIAAPVAGDRAINALLAIGSRARLKPGPACFSVASMLSFAGCRDCGLVWTQNAANQPRSSEAVRSGAYMLSRQTDGRGACVAAVEHDGRFVLSGGARGGSGEVRQARDFQHRPRLAGRIQAVVATRSLSADRRNRSSASAGVFQSSVFRGRELRAAATAAISLALCMLRSVPLGKYWRSSPLVFSLVPRCHGL